MRSMNFSFIFVPLNIIVISISNIIFIRYYSRTNKTKQEGNKETQEAKLIKKKKKERRCIE